MSSSSLVFDNNSLKVSVLGDIGTLEKSIVGRAITFPGRTVIKVVEKHLVGNNYNISTVYDVLRKSTSGEWINPCKTDSRGMNSIVFFRGRILHSSGVVEASDQLNFSCTSGAVGKCLLSGYRIDVSAGDRAGLDLFNSCVRMFRADYCGDGRSFTRLGRLVSYWRPNDSLPNKMMSFEAAWTEDGALCIHHARAPDVSDISEIIEYCPRLSEINGSDCTIGWAFKSGALLLNSSLVE